MPRRLRLQEYSMQVHLGCLAEERAHPQEVRVSLDIEFLEIPRAEQTDEIQDTICYAEICMAWDQVVQKREYHLVEKLSSELWVAIQPLLKRARSQIQVHKVSPPIDGLQGGVTYSCEEPL